MHRHGLQVEQAAEYELVARRIQPCRFYVEDSDTHAAEVKIQQAAGVKGALVLHSQMFHNAYYNKSVC